jgi:hypothetical protein
MARQRHAQQALNQLGKPAQNLVQVLYDTVVIPSTTSDPIHDIKLGSSYFKTLPASATIGAILLGAIGGRSLFALLRAPRIPNVAVSKENASSESSSFSQKPRRDFSELWDVLRRDTVALTMMLFTLDPLCDRVMIPALEKLKRIRLTHPGSNVPFAFNNLGEIYALRSGSLLHGILTEKMEHLQAFKNAMHQGLRPITHLTKPLPPSVALMKQKLFSSWEVLQTNLHFYHGLKRYLSGQLPESMFLSGLLPRDKQRVLQTLQQLTQNPQAHTQSWHHLEATLQKETLAQSEQLYKQMQQLEKLLPQHHLPQVYPEQWLANYARRSMAPAYLGAITLSTLLVGIAPVWVNKLLGERPLRQTSLQGASQPKT